ncbi:557_t:CDS:2 [Entrophospora sp. SA101]|nr:6251_t:CDS:2 [Entrophospora sp. SA101]CAJ0913311.1 557_t:CDS:2 [Entrophospora sp. SA101]
MRNNYDNNKITADFSEIANHCNTGNLTRIIQQHPPVAAQQQYNMPKIIAGPSGTFTTDEDLKTEYLPLLDNSSSHSNRNYGNMSTSEVEDVFIPIEDNCQFPRSEINACCPYLFCGVLSSSIKEFKDAIMNIWLYYYICSIRVRLIIEVFKKQIRDSNISSYAPSP